MIKVSHGVRKIDELLIGNGRAIILTKEPSSNIDKVKWDTIEEGTAFINPSNGYLRYKATNSNINQWNKFNPINLFDDKTIINQLLGDRCITNDKLAISSITNINLTDNCIENRNLSNSCVSQDKCVQESFNGGIFEDNSINGVKIEDISIDGEKIIPRSVEPYVLKINSITEQEIGQYCISIENKALSRNVVLEENISSSAISERVMRENSITLENNALNDLVVITDKIAMQAITEEKMAFNSITENNKALSDECIISRNIKKQNIKEEHMSENSITLKNKAISKAAIIGDNICDKAIDLNHIVDKWANVIKNAIFVESGIANVNGSLSIYDNLILQNGNISANKNDCSQSITGFRVYNPVFRDFAEAFKSESTLNIGDIVEIENGEYVRHAEPYSNKIVGVVSDQYALCLGATEEELKNKDKYPIGLLGRVYINILGKAEPGDFVISQGKGVGIAIRGYIPGCVAGKVLEKKSTYDVGKVLCLVQTI